MLNCKEIVQQASNYIDSDARNKSDVPYWQIRIHLILCHHCRRFVRHLQTTTAITAHIAQDTDKIDTDEILDKIKAHSQQP